MLNCIIVFPKDILQCNHTVTVVSPLRCSYNILAGAVSFVSTTADVVLCCLARVTGWYCPCDVIFGRCTLHLSHYDDVHTNNSQHMYCYNGSVMIMTGHTNVQATNYMSVHAWPLIFTNL